MNTEIDTVTLPAYWSTALVNNDFSGLEPAEAERCRAAIEKLRPWSVVDVVRDDAGDSRDPRFTWSYWLYDPGAGVSGGDVLDYTCCIIGSKTME